MNSLLWESLKAATASIILTHCSWRWKYLPIWGVALCWCCAAEIPGWNLRVRPGMLWSAPVIILKINNCCEILTSVCLLLPPLNDTAVIYKFPLFLIPKPNSYWSKFFTLRKSDLKGPFSKESKSATNGMPTFCFLLEWVLRKRIRKANWVSWKAFWDNFYEVKNILCT